MDLNEQLTAWLAPNADAKAEAKKANKQASDDLNEPSS